MKENESALYSEYIIDGIRYDMTPAELLDECMEYAETAAIDENFSDIIDESTDPPVAPFAYDSSRIEEYAARTAEEAAHERAFTMLYPEHFTRLQIAKALLSRLWSEGHFRLGDLRIWAQWEWNTRPIGNMAAFYASASAASEYIYGLGVRMTDYLFIESDHTSSAKFFAWLPDAAEDDIEESLESERLFKSSPYESRHPWIGEGRRCAPTLRPDPESWLIYIPFDTCPYRLGGSLLAQTNGHNGGPGPQIKDPDYFIDCYEVVREFTEDGIVMSGATVADGGLATAVKRMCAGCGIELDINGLLASYQDADAARILFGETPGVLIQISDQDYDYLDSQLLLQDVAYYPLGHPDPENTGFRIGKAARSGVAGILASLLGQASEGED